MNLEGVPYCSIETRGQPYDNPYFTLPLAMCDQLGLSPRHLAHALQPLSTYRLQGELDNPYVVAQILSGVSLTHEGLRQRYMKERLRDAFIADLVHLVERQGRMVCLFDSFEDITTEEENWLLDSSVVASRKWDAQRCNDCDRGATLAKGKTMGVGEISHLVDGLPLMDVKHLKNYAEKMNMRITDEEAGFYWKAWEEEFRYIWPW